MRNFYEFFLSHENCLNFFFPSLLTFPWKMNKNDPKEKWEKSIEKKFSRRKSWKLIKNVWILAFHIFLGSKFKFKRSEKKWASSKNKHRKLITLSVSSALISQKEISHLSSAGVRWFSLLSRQRLNYSNLTDEWGWWLRENKIINSIKS